MSSLVSHSTPGRGVEAFSGDSAPHEDMAAPEDFILSSPSVKSNVSAASSGRKRSSASSVSPDEHRAGGGEKGKKRSREASKEAKEAKEPHPRVAVVSPCLRVPEDKENEASNVNNAVKPTRMRRNAGGAGQKRKSKSPSASNWDTISGQRRSSSGSDYKSKSMVTPPLTPIERQPKAGLPTSACRRNLKFDSVEKSEGQQQGMRPMSFYGTNNSQSPSPTRSITKIKGGNRGSTYSVTGGLSSLLGNNSSSSQSANPPRRIEPTPVRRVTEDLELLGFPNLGNTCFVNSLMVCLTGLPAFRRDFHEFMSQLKSDVGVENVSSFRVLNAFYRLLCDRETGRTHDFRVVMREIIGVIGKAKDYGVNEYSADQVKQQDVHEFMLHFLDQIETELKDYLNEFKDRRANPFIEFFGANAEVKKTCTNCGKVQVDTDGSVPMESHIVHFSSQENHPNDELSHMLRATFKSRTKLPCDKCQEKQKSKSIEGEKGDDKKEVNEDGKVLDEKSEKDVNSDEVFEDEKSSSAPTPSTSQAKPTPAADPAAVSEYEEAKTFRSVPRVLVLSLTASRSMAAHMSSKVTRHVDIPTELNLSEWIDQDAAKKQDLLERIQLPAEATRGIEVCENLGSKSSEIASSKEPVAEVKSEALCLVKQPGSKAENLDSSIGSMIKMNDKISDTFNSAVNSIVTESLAESSKREYFDEDGRPIPENSQAYEDAEIRHAINLSLTEGNNEPNGNSTNESISSGIGMSSDVGSTFKSHHEVEVLRTPEKFRGKTRDEIIRTMKDDDITEYVMHESKIEAYYRSYGMEPPSQAPSSECSMNETQTTEEDNTSASSSLFVSVNKEGDSSGNFADISSNLSKNPNSSLLYNIDPLKIDTSEDGGDRVPDTSEVDLDLELEDSDLTCNEQFSEEIERPKNPHEPRLDNRVPDFALESQSEIEMSTFSESTDGGGGDSGLARMARIQAETRNEVRSLISVDEMIDSLTDESSSANFGVVPSGHGVTESSEAHTCEDEGLGDFGNILAEEKSVDLGSIETSYSLSTTATTTTTSDDQSNGNEEFKVPFVPAAVVPRAPAVLPWRDLEPQVDGLDPDFDYKLVAVVRHISNSISSGHYTADVFSQKHNKWYRYNDDIVNVISTKDVVTDNARQAYLVFYLHKDYFLASANPNDGSIAAKHVTKGQSSSEERPKPELKEETPEVASVTSSSGYNARVIPSYVRARPVQLLDISSSPEGMSFSNRLGMKTTKPNEKPQLAESVKIR